MHLALVERLVMRQSVPEIYLAHVTLQLFKLSEDSSSDPDLTHQVLVITHLYA